MWQAILAIVSVAGVLASGQSNVTKAHRVLDLLRSQPPARDGTNRSVGIVRTCDDQAVGALRVPLAVADASPVFIARRFDRVLSLLRARSIARRLSGDRIM